MLQSKGAVRPHSALFAHQTGISSNKGGSAVGAPGGQRLMQCQNCGLLLDSQQVAQTGRCPRCGNPVALASQSHAQQPTFPSGPPAGAGGASDDESPTIRVRPQAPEPAPPATPAPGPVDPYAATQRAPGPPPATPSGPYGPPPGPAAGPMGQQPASNQPPPTDPYVPSAAGFAPAPTAPYMPSAAGFTPQPAPPQPAGAAPGSSGPGQPQFSGPPQPPFGAPPPGAFGAPPQPPFGAPPQGGFSGPGQPPPYGSAPTFGGPGQPPPYGAPPGGFAGQPPMPGPPGGPVAPPPKKSRTGLIIAILLIILLVGGLGSVAALGFAGKGPLSSLGATPTPAATATPKATPTPNVPTGFQQFTSSDNSFSIAYPAGWQQQEASTGTGAQFTGPNQEFLEVARLSSDGSAAAFDSGFCSVISSGGTPSAPQTVSIGGQSWTQQECDSGGGIALHAVVEAVSYKGSLYYIAYLATADLFTQDKTSFFGPMEQSFQFLS